MKENKQKLIREMIEGKDGRNEWKVKKGKG